MTATSRPSARDLVEAARSVAASVLGPRAEDTDRADRVPADNLESLAAAGLFGLAGPQPDGAAAPTPVVRDVHEALAGACGATFFVWAQHHTPVRLLSGTENAGLRERWLDRLCSGRAIAGVAFAYLRWENSPVTARAVPGGYRVAGVAPWATSWGMAEVFVVGARLPGDHIVWFCLDGRPTGAVRPSPPQELVVMQATVTVRLAFEDLFVPDDDVVLVESLEGWRRQDRVTTSQPSPAALGVAQTSCRLLAEHAVRTGSRTVAATKAALSAELEASRHRAYALADEAVPESGDEREAHLARLVDARVSNLEMAQIASQALVTAVGGSAMTRTHPAQRLAREAMFYVVQAQTAAIRRAGLERLSADRSRTA